MDPACKEQRETELGRAVPTQNLARQERLSWTESRRLTLPVRGGGAAGGDKTIRWVAAALGASGERWHSSIQLRPRASR